MSRDPFRAEQVAATIAIRAELSLLLIEAARVSEAAYRAVRPGVRQIDTDLLRVCSTREEHDVVGRAIEVIEARLATARRAVP